MEFFSPPPFVPRYERDENPAGGDVNTELLELTHTPGGESYTKQEEGQTEEKAEIGVMEEEKEQDKEQDKEESCPGYVPVVSLLHRNRTITTSTAASGYTCLTDLPPWQESHNVFTLVTCIVIVMSI